MQLKRTGLKQSILKLLLPGNLK